MPKSYFQFMFHPYDPFFMFSFICFSFSGAPKKIRIEEEDQEYIGKSRENGHDCWKKMFVFLTMFSFSICSILLSSST